MFRVEALEPSGFGVGFSVSQQKVYLFRTPIRKIAEMS